MATAKKQNTKKAPEKKAEPPKKAPEKKAEPPKKEKPKADPKVEAERNALIQELSAEPYEQAVGDLTKMNLDALKALKISLDKELALKKKPKKGKPAVEFSSFCGSPFDPSPKATCAMQCSKDMPDEYKKCEEHFKATYKEKASGSMQKTFKSKRKLFGKDFMGWGSGTSASMINLMLVDGHTIKEMGEHIGCPESRIRAHLGNLMKNHNMLARIRKVEGGIYKITSEEFLKSLTVGML